jgi:hypothetical protein
MPRATLPAAPVGSEQLAAAYRARGNPVALRRYPSRWGASGS